MASLFSSSPSSLLLLPHLPSILYNQPMLFPTTTTLILVSFLSSINALIVPSNNAVLIGDALSTTSDPSFADPSLTSYLVPIEDLHPLAHIVAVGEPSHTLVERQAAPRPSGIRGSLQWKAMKSHNDFRALYGAQPLAWNKTLVAAAQKWGNGCVFKHSGGVLGPFGENLAVRPVFL